MLINNLSDFIVEGIESGRDSLVQTAAKRFSVTRQTVTRQLNKLIQEGVIKAEGNTRGRKYSLLPLVEQHWQYPLTPSLAEDVVWRMAVMPHLEPRLRDNVLRICETGFSEILNNAIDHSEGSRVDIELRVTAGSVEIYIADDGVGVFEKIMRVCGLSDHRQAMLELSKGKLTTDPARHSGQGIFFASRMFDDFVIQANNLFFGHKAGEEDWLIETDPAKQTPVSGGTTVNMTISTFSTRTTKEVYDRFTSDDGDFDFTKTHVPIRLARYAQEHLVSRSQAKRILARFDKFTEVLLDFEGIDQIGQAFADEIFRVFPLNHPQTRVIHVGAGEQVEQMIRRAKAAANSLPPDPDQMKLF